MTDPTSRPNHSPNPTPVEEPAFHYGRPADPHETVTPARAAKGEAVPDPLAAIAERAKKVRQPALNPKGYQDANMLSRHGRLMSQLLALPLDDALAAFGKTGPSAASVLRVLAHDAGCARLGKPLPQTLAERAASVLAMTDREAAHVLLESLSTAWAALRRVRKEMNAAQQRDAMRREYVARQRKAGAPLSASERRALLQADGKRDAADGLSWSAIERAEHSLFGGPAALTPIACVEDGHLVPRDTRWALGLVTTASAVTLDRHRRLNAAFARAADAAGLAGDLRETAANVWQHGAPILVIDELTTLTRKLVEDLWSAAPRLAVLYLGPLQKLNPFAWLGIPMIHDPKGEIAALLEARTAPTLIEPIVGGMRITMASGLPQLRVAKPAAAAPWVLTFAQTGVLRRAADTMLLMPEGVRLARAQAAAAAQDETEPTEEPHETNDAAPAPEHRWLDPTSTENKPWRAALLGAERMPARERLAFYRGFLTLFDFPVTAFDRSGLTDEDRQTLRTHNEAFKNDFQNLRACVEAEAERLEGLEKRRQAKPRGTRSAEENRQ